MAEQNTAEELDIYVGGEPDDDLEETTSAVDRGDSLEPVADEAPKEEEPTVAEEPKAEEETPPAEEPKAEEETPPAEEPKAEDPRIPKARFDEVNQRMKAAEAKLQALEEEARRKAGDTEGTEQFDFDSKEQEYMEAVVDGEFEKARAIRAEIRRAEQAAFTQTAQATKQEAVATTKMELEFAQTVQKLEAEYPAFDNKNEAAYDPIATQEVLDLHDAYLATGKYQTPSESLAAAAELIALKYRYNAPAVVEEEPSLGSTPSKGKTAAQGKSPAEKVAAAQAQPPKPQSGTAQTGQHKSLADLSEEEFDALPESVKAEARGDIL